MTQAGSFRHLYIARASAIALPSLLVAIALLRSPPRCPMARHFHLPCPGCGLTRASRFLLAGDVSSSLHLQPLLVPLALSLLSLFAGVTLATLFRGSPGGLVETRSGRFVLGAAALVTIALTGLWLLRFAGFFGGPVPV